MDLEQHFIQVRSYKQVDANDNALLERTTDEHGDTTNSKAVAEGALQ